MFLVKPGFKMTYLERISFASFVPGRIPIPCFEAAQELPRVTIVTRTCLESAEIWS